MGPIRSSIPYVIFQHRSTDLEPGLNMSLCPSLSGGGVTSAFLHYHPASSVMARVSSRQAARATANAKASRTRLDKPSVISARSDPNSSKKWQQYSRLQGESPFPRFSRPSSHECQQAHRVLADLHGDRDPLSSNAMNADGMDRPSSFPDVLDGLVYGLLCQATNENNAIRQVSSMDAQYGSWKNYDAIVTRGEAKLAETLRCGGLHVRKAKLLTSLLRQVEAKNENYTLNYLHKMSDEDAMQELLSYSGIGPKTASCVLALTLQRQRFVVDTHIHRITGMLGWRPAGASPEQARAHLECRIPDEHKYALHLLFIAHGRECLQCRAGSKDKDCAILKEIKESVSQKDDGVTGERN